jgi:hypothetical protein
MARLMWIAISVTFRITKPDNFANLVGHWLRSFSHKLRVLGHLGWLLFVGRYGLVEMKLCSKK